ncbi:MAG: tetratricopeptide repeat protein [Myxococcales bacterium]|jgi:tetratricopeptide (TPR) repeat protein|nr:tetratricopeptide repeat protein [Myxococcales bacterium]
MRRSLVSLGLALVALFSASGASLAAQSQLRGPLASFESRGKSLEQQADIIERLYMDRSDALERDGLKRRFSDAELQFLLQHYEAASTLFYDLIGNKAFEQIPGNTEALYMLAESLYQLQGFHGARFYFREYLSLSRRGQRGNHFLEALLRHIDLSARFRDFAGIETYIQQLRRPDGTLPAEVAYAYGKWFFGRKDLPEAERQRQAGDLFLSVIKTGGTFIHQAHYFRGVLAVQRGDLEAALDSFQALVRIPANSPTASRVHEQAHLAMGRILIEQGHYSQAIDRYQYIDYQSDTFIDALYESAWAYVRRAVAEGDTQDFQKALHACERITTTAPDALIAQDALVLQGHLLLRLGQFDAAGLAYRGVIANFQPAYDGLAERLAAHKDPVEFLQAALQNSDETLDLKRFLPKFAIPWATTERDITEAIRITTDIDETRQAIAQSFETAERLVEQIDQRRSELFPFFQKGFSQADALEMGLSTLRRDLIDFEQAALTPPGKDAPEHGPFLDQRARLDALRTERAALEQALQDQPRTEADFMAWRKSITDRIRSLEQAAHRVAMEIEGLFALQAASDKLLRDMDPKDLSDSDRVDFARQLVSERAVAEGLRKTLGQRRRALAEERSRVERTRPDNDALRNRYATLLDEERRETKNLRGLAPAAAARLPTAELDRLHESIAALYQRTSRTRAHLGERIDAQATVVRSQIIQEVSQLETYQQRSRANASNARGLVGTIAFQSFTRLLGRFYDAMVKAEVGLVDIAWTRKQNLTEKIQSLASQKDGELRSLELDFKEALTEAK